MILLNRPISKLVCLIVEEKKVRKNLQSTKTSKSNIKGKRMSTPKVITRVNLLHESFDIQKLIPMQVKHKVLTCFSNL